MIGQIYVYLGNGQRRSPNGRTVLVFDHRILNF